MRRACKVTLKFCTKRKLGLISALLESYRSAVNFYIKTLWNNGGSLDKATLGRLTATRLSERYKSAALKQAEEVVRGTRRASEVTGNACSMPRFSGSATLDAKFVTIECGEGSFDLVIKLSTLEKGNRITIPTRKTKILNKWLSKKGSSLIQGCTLSEHGIVLWVCIPDPVYRVSGKVLAFDIGINKLLVDSDGNRYGTDFKEIMKKVKRKKPGSKGMLRARRERDQYIDRVVNQLPWSKLKAIGIDALKNVKKGKSKKRSKSFRKAVTPWAYRRAIARAKEKAQENRVRPVEFLPAYTSRTCPSCGTVSSENRRGESFLCVCCGYKADADFVGARNGLVRTLATLGSLESPRLTR